MSGRTHLLSSVGSIWPQSKSHTRGGSRADNKHYLESIADYAVEKKSSYVQAFYFKLNASWWPNT